MVHGRHKRRNQVILDRPTDDVTARLQGAAAQPEEIIIDIVVLV